MRIITVLSSCLVKLTDAFTFLEKFFGSTVAKFRRENTMVEGDEELVLLMLRLFQNLHNWTGRDGVEKYKEDGKEDHCYS